MAARWTNKRAILRDLAYAQGSTPLNIANPISSNTKPPREAYKEETEEGFYTDCVENGDFSNGPDIGMIRELLNAVREASVSPDLDANSPIEISKLYINGESSIGSTDDQASQLKNPSGQKENTKKRKNRNAAILSIMETYGNNNEDSKLKLLKPTDFMQEESSSQNQVASSLDSTQNRLLSPASMFCKKIVPSNVSMFKKKERVKEVTIKCDNETEVYVPSSMANEYYEKYVEKSKMRETLNEDIWTRAENKMKEIDERRKKEKESLMLLASSQTIASEGDSNISTDSILVKEPSS